MNCRGCKYFYITWDNRIPNGCRAYQFKSKLMPYIAVKQSSGEDCKLYKRRGKKAGKKDNLDLNRDDLW